MTLKLSELVNETAEGSFEVGGEEVHVTFYRNDSSEMHAEALTEGRVTEDDLQAAAAKDASVFVSNSVLLATRIKSWDWHYLDGEERKPLPLTAAIIRRLQGKHFRPLWEAVFGRPDAGVPTDARD